MSTFYQKFIDEAATITIPIYSATTESYTPLKRGDRVRIREGYDSAGAVGFYEAKSNDTDGVVLVTFGDTVVNTLLADAIEPYPYTREERIERAIEDFEDRLSEEFPMATHTLVQSAECHALLFAIIDAGV